MPSDAYIMSTDGEVTLIDQYGTEYKIRDMINFTIESDIENISHRSHESVDLVIPISQTFTLGITFGRLEVVQPSKITKKSVRRKIR